MQCPVAIQCYLALTLCGAVLAEYYDVFTGQEINQTRYEDIERVGLVPICAVRVDKCNEHEVRRMDLSCNNLKFPARGVAFTPFKRMLSPVFSEGGAFRRSQSGQPLPLARPLRVGLLSDGRRSDRRFTQMMSNYNVFIASDITSVHDTANYVSFTTTCCQPGGEQNPQCMPVVVKDDDIHLRTSSVRCMNLTRAITFQQLGCAPEEVPRERIDLAAPMLELSSVYGHDGAQARRARELRGGRLRVDIINGKEWPPNGSIVCVNNVPPRETRCHDSGVPSTSALLGINLMYIWFYRSHNGIADALAKINPCWDDDKLYFTAREINIAYYLQMLYYEVLPQLFGWEFLLHNKVVYDTDGHVNDYDPTLEPGLAIEFTMASRWFHTLQEGTLNMYKSDGRLYSSVQIVDMIFRTGFLPIDGNMEGLTQGAFRQPGGAIDEVVDPDMGERVLGRLQVASDVISNDIMKSRDFGLPPYNQYRKACGLPQARKFKDLLGWMDRPQVEVLATFYEHPDDIELSVAFLAEKPMPGAVLGATLACVLADQFVHWRRSDRFWYEHEGHPGAFTLEQLHEIRKMVFSKFFCLHGDGVHAVQPNAFVLPGHGNEITNCTEYEMPDLNAFRDDGCYPHPTPRHKAYPEPMPHHKAYSEPTPRHKEYPDHTPLRKKYPEPNPHKAYSDPTPHHKEYPESNSHKAYSDPTQHHKVYSEPTPYHKAYPDSTARHKAYPDPTPRHKAYPNPTPRNEDYTTLNAHLADIFKINQFMTLATSQPKSYPNNIHATHKSETTSSKSEYIDSLKSVKAETDSTILNLGDPKSSEEDCNRDFTIHTDNCDPTSAKINPNANREHPKNDETSKIVSIPNRSNLNSKSRSHNREYPNVHPAVRNKKYPYEEFLQNFWQSSNSDRFKAFQR